jgi:hypothetical protein
MIWRLSHRGDSEARVFADRHYSRQQIGTPQFVPPGRCLVLVAEHAYWVTSWPFAEYVKHRWGGAWICSAFRREGGPMRASDMIVAAVAATRAYFGEPPSLGMVTFVDASKVRRKRDPGRCFIRAGFTVIGETEGGLVSLQLLPSMMPAPDLARGMQLALTAP